jgi:predicted nucleic acid-binding protein
LIYVDSSVALAYLLSETRRPPSSLWKEQLVTSRLLEYEVGVRINARGLGESHSQIVDMLLKRFHFLEMVPAVLSRALEPFPLAVRTLDALHLASAEFLRAQGEAVSVATYDDRLMGAAKALGFEIADL